MPDIISRIKVEAQGADQAAREILKLRDAYLAAGAAAKGMSASTGGSTNDPFTKATNAGGGSRLISSDAEGMSTADIMSRESRERNRREGVKEREDKHTGSNYASGVDKTFDAMNSVGDGSVLGGIGKLARTLGPLLGGPAGIATMVGGAVAYGVNSLGNKAYERMSNIFGSGMSQRLGVSYDSTNNAILRYSAAGMPQSMVQSFFSNASSSGVDMTKASSAGAIDSSIRAAALLGTDTSATASLVGTLNRAGANAGAVNSKLFGMAQKSFGMPNTTQFVQALQSLTETLSSKGINISGASTTELAKNIAGLTSFGGFSTPGAVTTAQGLQARGIQAAQLNTPEDVLAFQAMRKPGESIMATQIRMEENPEAVNKVVYEYLKSQYGSNQDAMLLHFKQYLNMDSSQTVKVAKFFEEEGKAKDRDKSLGYSDAWEGIALKFNATEIGTTAMKQNEFFAPLQADALKTQTAVTKFTLGLLQNDKLGFTKDIIGKNGVVLPPVSLQLGGGNTYGGVAISDKPLFESDKVKDGFDESVALKLRDTTQQIQERFVSGGGDSASLATIDAMNEFTNTLKNMSKGEGESVEDQFTRLMAVLTQILAEHSIVYTDGKYVYENER